MQLKKILIFALVAMLVFTAVPMAMAGGGNDQGGNGNGQGGNGQGGNGQGGNGQGGNGQGQNGNGQGNGPANNTTNNNTTDGGGFGSGNPVSTIKLLYAGNTGFYIYPYLANDSISGVDVTFVEMYDTGFTGPSDDLLTIAWNTVDSSNPSNPGVNSYVFTDFDIAFYDMGEFWHYPFGNYDENGSYVGVGAYDIAGYDPNVPDSGKTTAFVALRSADWVNGSSLTSYPFAIIDDIPTTETSSIWITANASGNTVIMDYLEGFFDSTNIYDANDYNFIGNATQAKNFVDYVFGIFNI